MENELEIAVVNTADEAREYVKKGYTPVECSFGSESVVDELELDHHGSMSDKESVAIRAYRDLFGVRANNKKIVVNHIDADNMFAIASVCGLLPHPNSAYAASLPPFQQKPWQQDLMPLAETIATMDTDPIGREVLKMPYGQHLVMWNSIYGSLSKTRLQALSAVQGWITITTSRNVGVYLDAAKNSEQARIDMAKKDLEERGKKEGDVFVIRNSRMFGFDVWYGRDPEKGKPTEAAGWKHPIVLSLTEEQQNITIGVPSPGNSVKVAEELLGKGGLKNVFDRLNKLYECPEGAGFGGRECIGGSPRGRVMKEEDVRKIAVVINQVCKEERERKELLLIQESSLQRK